MARRRLPDNHPLRLPAGVKLVNGRPVFSGFSPTAAQAIPPGLYDPALDATLGQAKRGFQDLWQGAQTQAQRGQVDYGLAGDAIDRSQQRGGEDLAQQRSGLETSFSRGGEDVATQRAQLGVAQQREGENYGLAQQNVGRQYGQLANQQRQQQAAYGVLRGGAAMQAARKRAANQALDRQPMDLEHARAGQDFATQGTALDTAQARLAQDHTTQLGALDTAGTRLGQDSDLARGMLALQSAPPDAANPLGGRSYQDLGTQLNVAARELGATGIDTNREKAYSAAQMGYVPPNTPKNEQTNPLTGNTTRSYTIGGVHYTVDPHGRIVAKKRVR